MATRQELAPFASEFVGTYFQILTIGLNVLQNHPLGPISVGFMLTAMIFTSGSVSGGHFNPAVTMGVCLSGRQVISARRACLYIVVQLLGSLCASLTTWRLLGATFALQPGRGYSWSEAAVVEVIYTAALVFVVLNTATLSMDKSPFQNDFAGLAIGFTVVSAAFSGGAVSGCSLNPALAVGALGVRAFDVGLLDMSCFRLYVLCPFLGALAAVLLFGVVRPSEYLDFVIKPHSDFNARMSRGVA